MIERVFRWVLCLFGQHIWYRQIDGRPNRCLKCGKQTKGDQR